MLHKCYVYNISHHIFKMTTTRLYFGGSKSAQSQKLKIIATKSTQMWVKVENHWVIQVTV